MIFLKKITATKKVISIVLSLYCCFSQMNTYAETKIDSYESQIIETLNELLSSTPEYLGTVTEVVGLEESYKIPVRAIQPQPKRHITFMTYMAADNNLAYFAKKNLDQQAQIGSNNLINIVTELDTRIIGKSKGN